MFAKKGMKEESDIRDQETVRNGAKVLLLPLDMIPVWGKRIE